MIARCNGRATVRPFGACDKAPASEVISEEADDAPPFIAPFSTPLLPPPLPLMLPLRAASRVPLRLNDGDVRGDDTDENDGMPPPAPPLPLVNKVKESDGVYDEDSVFEPVSVSLERVPCIKAPDNKLGPAVDADAMSRSSGSIKVVVEVLGADEDDESMFVVVIALPVVVSSVRELRRIGDTADDLTTEFANR